MVQGEPENSLCTSFVVVSQWARHSCEASHRIATEEWGQRPHSAQVGWGGEGQPSSLLASSLCLPLLGLEIFLLHASPSLTMLTPSVISNYILTCL